MKWKELLRCIPPDMGSFAIDFYGADTRNIKEFLTEVGLDKPFYADVARYTRLGRYAGWVPHKDRYDAYEAENPIVSKIKVFDFAEAYAICCENETYSDIPLEEVLML